MLKREIITKKNLLPAKPQTGSDFDCVFGLCKAEYLIVQ